MKKFEDLMIVKNVRNVNGNIVKEKKIKKKLIYLN